MSEGGASGRILVRTLIIAGLALVLILGGSFYGLQRERRLAIAVASDAVGSILGDSAEAVRHGLPKDFHSGSYEVADVDLFERNWLIWFELEGTESLAVTVFAPRGISFFPLFNRGEDLEVSRVEYVPRPPD